MELQFWTKQVEHINGKEIWHSPSAVQVVFSDASGMGYGGFTVENGCHITHGAWSEDQAVKSFKWRELRAVRMLLESLIPKLKNERIRWFSDNQNVVRIMEIGSKIQNCRRRPLQYSQSPLRTLSGLSCSGFVIQKTSKQIT